MYLCNNGSIRLSRSLTDDEKQKLGNAFDLDSESIKAASDKIVINGGISYQEQHEIAYIDIEEESGDLTDILNEIAEEIGRYGVTPLHGEYNVYFGDYDGYDVYDAEAKMFVSMTQEEYGVWQHLNSEEGKTRITVFIENGQIKAAFSDKKNVELRFEAFSLYMGNRRELEFKRSFRKCAKDMTKLHTTTKYYDRPHGSVVDN